LLERHSQGDLLQRRQTLYPPLTLSIMYGIVN
jgi:hypothetical protein